MGWPRRADTTRPAGHGAGWSWLDSCAVAGTQELAGPACGSVGDRREGTVRGYRKARHVRAHVGLQVLDIAPDAELDRGSVAQHQVADFAGRVSDSGEGRWTSIAAIDEGVPAPVLTAALSGDLTRRTAEPTTIFRASEASWSKEMMASVAVSTRA